MIISAPMRDVCPICQATAPRRLDHRASVPVVLNRLAATVEQARAIACGELDMVSCGQCGFVWNRTFQPDAVPYDPEYENDQTHSAAFRAHVAQMAERVLAAAPQLGALDIAEVGCGQGAFLNALAVDAGERLHSAVGFDPAFRSDSAV
jgi:hypothetical protein